MHSRRSRTRASPVQLATLLLTMLTPPQLPQTTFDLRAILQKHDNLRATSDKMKYEITALQDF